MSSRRRIGFRAPARFATAAAVALVAALALSGCMPEESSNEPIRTSQSPSPKPSIEPQPTAKPGERVTLVSITDGDTITTSAGKVRIIGIDTPERSDCGYEEAAAALRSLIKPGDTVTLVLPTGQSDTDKYDRLLRYVEAADGTDAGLELIREGHAVARYDSLDGYPAHPRQAAYHDAQIATLTADGRVLTPACAATGGGSADASGSAAAPGGQGAAGSADGDAWYLKYPSCAALKRNTVGDPTGPFSRDDQAEAEIYDWFANGTGNHGDGDGDGLACE